MQVSNNAPAFGELHRIIQMENLLAVFLILYPEIFFSVL